MSSLETRSASALFKRAEQLKRWQESHTNQEPVDPKRKTKKIQFTDGCVFLAACAASDKEEVQRLLIKGADIDTSNVDGLTALHQACIDDNLEMVEFLVEHDADVNRGDNEGWTPLHATASCGFLSIAKYLLDHGANVSAVNNDGELAIDISESDEMEELLQKEIEANHVDCEASRHCEERIMLEDARQWLNAKIFGDVVHPKTGATALHVAAAKGYMKVMNLLLQAGANVNSHDFDGWTPLHAAAHWAQKEAVELLCEHGADMDLKNFVGQVPFDVADPEVLRLLEDLKKKQISQQKDKPIQGSDIRLLIHRPPTVPSSNVAAGTTAKRRSSITRLSVDDKALRSKEVSSQERDLLLTKAMVPETIVEKKDAPMPFDASTPHEGLDKESSRAVKDEGNVKAPGYSPPHYEEKRSLAEAENTELEQVHPWRRPASLRVRPSTGLEIYSGLTGSSGNRLSPLKTDVDVTLRRVHSFESDDKFYIKRRELRNRIRAATSEHPDDQQLASESPEENRPNSPTSQSNTNPTLSWRSKSGRKEESSTRASADVAKSSSQVRRSFVPPVRDEESETQRKAHAKRVRETRRSTQGVTLEDLKSAEQLVKRKQQQENQLRTSELQQLVASQKPDPPTLIPNDHQQSVPSAAVTAVSSTPPSLSSVSIVVTSSPSTSSASSHSSSFDASDRHDRRPSWRLRLDASDKNKFRLEEEHRARSQDVNHSSASAAIISPSRTRAASASSASSSPSDGAHQVISRRKKPKRRSTGVVQIEMEDVDADDDLIEEEEDEEATTLPTQESIVSVLSNSSARDAGASSSDRSQNGEMDYKKLWEEAQLENTQLRDELSKLRDELKSSKKLPESSLNSNPGASSSAGLGHSSSNEMEKRERQALEKKLSEMEAELKQLEHFRTENQRLRDENGALIRVISKLSK